MLRKDQQTHFKNIAKDEQLALKSLQEKLIRPSVLSLPKSTGAYTQAPTAVIAKHAAVSYRNSRKDLTNPLVIRQDP